LESNPEINFINVQPAAFSSAGANFINILCASFLCESKLSSFSLEMFGFINFWRQNISEKRAHKMLMKLTPDPEIEKSFLRFWGSAP